MSGASPRLSRNDVRGSRESAGASIQPEIHVGLLTGGFDRPYAFGLAMALIAKDVRLDFIGGDEVDSPELHTNPGLEFLNLRGNQRADASLARKISRVLIYYARLIRYAAKTRPKVFHILWSNKFEFFDRTLLMSYYKLRRKKVVLTVHNVNSGTRDSDDSSLNRLTLRIQYRLADHLFVHTERMKRELREEFGVRERAITVIPFGINNAVQDTALTPEEAKRQLGIGDDVRTMLFFGAIRPYKGLEHLVAAFRETLSNDMDFRLIIAGEPKRGSEKYLEAIQRAVSDDVKRGRIIQRIQYIPDEETELYFKAADVLVLPYTHIFQSGVLFLGYRFGLPVIASDVGSFRDDIVEGRTGFLCRPCDPIDLGKTIRAYFESDLFINLNSRRQEIRDYATARHSWDVIGDTTRNVYAELLETIPRVASRIPGDAGVQRAGTDC